MEAISNEDFQHLISIKDQRNVIAHKLPYILLEPQKDVDIHLLIKAKELIEKIEKWWIYNVAIPINQDLNDETIQEEQIKPGCVIILDQIFKTFTKIFRE